MFKICQQDIAGAFQGISKNQGYLQVKDRIDHFQPYILVVRAYCKLSMFKRSHANIITFIAHLPFQIGFITSGI
jgi:hypothetical protein